MKLTREQIIAIAWEAKADYDNGVWSLTYDELEAFAALVAAAERERLEATAWGASQKWIYRAIEGEREACAKLCDEKVAAEYATGKVDHNEMGWTQACARAIRARGLAQLNASAEANGEEL